MPFLKHWLAELLWFNNPESASKPSLSKVYNAIYRFSEDIDLAILPGEDWSNAKITRVMKQAISQASSGLIDTGEAIVADSYHGRFQMMITQTERNPSVNEIARVFEQITKRLRLYSASDHHLNCLTLKAQTAD